MKNVKTIKELRNHPLVDDVWKEFQDYQYDDTDYVFWLKLKYGYFFEVEQSSSITTRANARDIIEKFNLLQKTIKIDDRD